MARFKIGRAVVVAGLGGVTWQGFPRFVQWMNDFRSNSLVVGVDPDTIEVRNGTRQWSSGLHGFYKVNAWQRMLRQVEWSNIGGKEPMMGTGVLAILGSMMEDGVIQGVGSGSTYVNGRGIDVWPSCFSSSMTATQRSEVRLWQMFKEVVDPEEIWLFAMVDNQVGRVRMYEWAEKMAAEREGRPVYMVSAGNNKMGGWAACCRMTAVEGKVVKEGDWKVYRGDIWDGAAAEKVGKEQAESCASMVEQTAGSNGFTAQCLFGVVGAAENEWFGEYTWRYRTPEEAVKQGHGVTMVMIERK